MPFAYLTGTIRAAAASNVTTFGVDTTGVELLIAVASSFSPSGFTFSDNKSNTWIELPETLGVRAGQIAYCFPPGAKVGTGHTFTSVATGSSRNTLAVLAYSGTGTFDQQTIKSIAPAGSTTALTPTANNALVIAVWCDLSGVSTVIDGGYSIKQTYTATGTTAALVVADLIQTTAASTSPSWSVTVGASSAKRILASFLPAATNNRRRRVLLTNGGM